MQTSALIFDRKLLKLRRNRAVRWGEEYSFLFEENANRLAERVEESTREFPMILDLGCRQGLLYRKLARPDRTIVQCDISEQMVRQTSGLRLVADEEFLPFAEQSFDLVLSNISLHWVNDLPGTLLQIRKILKPNGIFIASMFGGQTLKELRHAFVETEIRINNGVQPRVSPFIDVKDAGMLLQRAGFTLPVIDSDIVMVDYSDPFRLMEDLRGMGESNILYKRSKAMMGKYLLQSAMDAYQEMFKQPDGSVPATFEIITLAGIA